jgi:hypothetical protein
MIQIPKNDYAVPTEVREKVVQAICEAFLSGNAFSIFHPATTSLYRRRTTLVLIRDGKGFGFCNEPLGEKEYERVRGCEMKAAFRELIKAGYHIFEVGNYRGDWRGYRVYKVPFIDGGREVFEFTDFID